MSGAQRNYAETGVLRKKRAAWKPPAEREKKPVQRSGGRPGSGFCLERFLRHFDQFAESGVVGGGEV